VYVFLALSLTAALGAAAAPVPINAPMVIAASGDYVVMHDFTSVGTPAIKITGAVTANISFAGHTVSAIGAPVVLVHSFNDDAGCRSVILHDGKIVGGYGLVSMNNPLRGCPPQVRVDRMIFQATDLNVEDGGLIVTSSQFVGGSIFARTDVGGLVTRIEGNRIVSGDIALMGGQGSRVTRNYVLNGSIYVRGSDGQQASNVNIASNYIVRGNVELGGTSAEQGAAHVFFARNNVAGFVKLMQVNDSVVDTNKIGGCGPAYTSVQVDGQANRVDRNAFLGGCDHGIVFDETATGNEYSYNTYRVYVPVPVLDLGTGNFDGSQMDVDPDLGPTKDLGFD